MGSESIYENVPSATSVVSLGTPLRANSLLWCVPGRVTLCRLLSLGKHKDEIVPTAALSKEILYAGAAYHASILDQFPGETTAYSVISESLDDELPTILWKDADMRDVFLRNAWVFHLNEAWPLLGLPGGWDGGHVLFVPAEYNQHLPHPLRSRRDRFLFLRGDVVTESHTNPLSSSLLAFRALERIPGAHIWGWVQPIESRFLVGRMEGDVMTLNPSLRNLQWGGSVELRGQPQVKGRLANVRRGLPAYHRVVTDVVSLVVSPEVEPTLAKLSALQGMRARFARHPERKRIMHECLQIYEVINGTE
jgi:hypothetical protein